MSDKILVVDDEPDARKILAHLLRTTCEVLEAATGEEALRIIKAQRPRLMLLDMAMPGMSGLEVLEAVRASGAPMTVIVVTGQNDIELAKRALALGAVEYVTKPFDFNDLKKKVDRSMAEAAKTRENEGEPPWRITDA